MSALPSSALGPMPAALAPAGWQQSAASRFTDRDLFFPPEEERGHYAGFREAAAKQTCRSCPVRGQCLGCALPANERYGVWGGMTAEERERLAGKAGAGGLTGRSTAFCEPRASPARQRCLPSRVALRVIGRVSRPTDRR